MCARCAATSSTRPGRRWCPAAASPCPPLEAEQPDESHKLLRESFDGEYFFTVPHEMRKDHYISFLAYVTTGRFDLVKLYPEGQPGARFCPRGGGWLYWYCNRHGLFREKL